MLKKVKKQIGLAFLAGVLLLGIVNLFSYPVFAEGVKIYENYEYQYNEEYSGIEIVKYKGKNKKVIIPEQIEGMPVVVIGYGAFAKKKHGSLTKH